MQRGLKILERTERRESLRWVEGGRVRGAKWVRYYKTEWSADRKWTLLWGTWEDLMLWSAGPRFRLSQFI